MARSLSAALREALFDPESGEVPLVLLTIAHASLPSPGGVVRLVNNDSAIVRLGQPFNPYPFDVTFPDDTDEGPGSAEVRLDNISREVVEWVRTVTGSPTVKIELVLASSPDVLEVEFDELEITEAEYDSLVVAAKLTPGDDTRDPVCAATYGPANFPGLLWAAG